MSGDLATVTWLTGLATDIEYGPSPFTVSPLVLLDPDGSVLTITSEDEAGGVGEGIEVLTFTGFALEDVDRPEAAARLAVEAVGSASAVTVDLASLPANVALELARRVVELVDVGPALRAARAVKDPDEINAIRAAIRLADAGQAAARESFASGRSELDVYHAAFAAIESGAGGRVPLLADVVTGPRTAEVGGPPSDRVIENGDLLLVDLVPRLAGYWGDSCATISFGEPSDEVARAHRAATDALRRGFELLRPGVRAGEVDEVVRKPVTDAGGSYPHHSGHGLGTAFHEAPRIVPGNDQVLEAGMIVALEPGVYTETWGLRTEHVALVTDGEPEILSRHDLSL
ncbi:MAG: aminopeptidase P family protein [Actinobacteria bacterium]|nr:aminopeptidase P family protein [Actinomycetota bacterium]